MAVLFSLCFKPVKKTIGKSHLLSLEDYHTSASFHQKTITRLQKWLTCKTFSFVPSLTRVTESSMQDLPTVYSPQFSGSGSSKADFCAYTLWILIDILCPWTSGTAASYSSEIIMLVGKEHPFQCLLWKVSDPGGHLDLRFRSSFKLELVQGHCQRILLGWTLKILH